MSDRNGKRLHELLKVPGNKFCADCHFPNPDWASYNIGVFLCTTCATNHRKLGSHITKVKSLKLDKWDDDQVDMMEKVGNERARQKYQRHVPTCYRIPVAGDPQVLLEQWIRAKYERKEFTDPDRQTYTCGHMEGMLMKKVRDDLKYYQRKFVIHEMENSLKYFGKDNGKEAKTTIPLSDLNVCLSPGKMHPQTSLQLSYICDGSTRHIYVYHDSGEEIVKWYMAIRSAKLNRLLVAYPSATEMELAPYLTTDFALEGYLWKTGPSERDSYRKRWFILDDRKLMYHEGPMDAYPRGEIFLGHIDDGYILHSGAPRGCKEQDFPFSLTTPERVYVMSAATADLRDQWMGALGAVLQRPLRPQDNLLSVTLVRKRSGRFRRATLDILSFV